MPYLIRHPVWIPAFTGMTIMKMEYYNPQKIEAKWQKHWEEHPELFAADDKSNREKTYILDMFPYPSADGLHTGHVESYTATDIISRYLRMRGKNVLHPQGWDAFGLPAENYAIKTKTHPSITTQRAIATFKRQMKMMGLSYDWLREINSSNPEYYKWTQWFFLLLYKNGLAYRAKAKANWCENCQTVLANEQAEGGVCERCGHFVVQKEIEQWLFKITNFIENLPSEALAKDGRITSGLLNGLDKIDWPEHTKTAQKNWIGKSQGAQFRMRVILNGAKRSEESPANAGQDPRQAGRSFADAQDDIFIEVFTTRLDTVFGMTFALIAPEHEIVQKLKPHIENWHKVEKYISEAKKKSELQRISEVKEKTGVELKGIKVVNPFTNQEIPLFVSDFILAHYGTGAVMAVPGHDQRDYEFAKKFDLPIVEVIKSVDAKSSIKKEAFVEDGILSNSREYDHMTSQQAREKMTEWLETNRIGSRKINYKLRDWLVSRQRYWGAPIPIIYCEKCGTVPVPEKDLPVLLPDDVDFMPHGESPLARSKKFHDVKCSQCGAKARRESDTIDTFVCSSWYYFRYADPKNEKEFASKEKIKKWLPVDLYVGGAEHVVLHLLYSRFFTKVLHHFGFIDFDEPFLKLRHQGIVLAEDGRKMSKSLGNVINPDDVVARFGADALRLFEMFMGPLEDSKKWDTRGIMGTYRFLEGVWNYIFGGFSHSPFHDDKALKLWLLGMDKIKTPPEVLVLLNKTIKKVGEDVDNLKFNTAISQLMILRNSFYKVEEDEIRIFTRSRIGPTETGRWIEKSDFEKFLIILSPFAPHLAEEMWRKLGHKKSIFTEKWPEYDKNLVKDETIELIIQINGKLRDKIEVPADISEEDAKKTALESEKVQKFLNGQELKKVIFVRGRLVNIVI